MGIAITVAVVLVFVACVAFILVYHRSGSRWWASHLGRALVILGACLMVIVGYVGERRIATGSPAPADGAAIVELGIFSVVAGAVGYLAWAFRTTLAVWRMRRSAKSTNKETIVTEVTPGQPTTPPVVHPQATEQGVDANQPTAETVTPADETLAQRLRDFLSGVEHDAVDAAEAVTSHIHSWLSAKGL